MIDLSSFRGDEHRKRKERKGSRACGIASKRIQPKEMIENVCGALALNLMIASNGLFAIIANRFTLSPVHFIHLPTLNHRPSPF